MPRFSHTGHDMCLCQICGRDVDTGAEQVEWKPEVTGSESAGNVCSKCLFLHARTKLTGEVLRAAAARDNRAHGRQYGNPSRRTDRPMGVYEVAAGESGLRGAALHRYVMRHYGHG